MKRRSFLLSAGLTGLAGCSSSSETSPNPTPTSTAESTPEIQNLSLLTHWDTYGDILDNQVQSIGLGGPATIGVRYQIPVHDGQSKEVVQTTIYHDDSSVDTRSRTDTRLSDEGASSESYERSENFETSDWETGSYSAELLVRDNVTGNNSRLAQKEFDVIDPLSSSEVELSSVETPPEIKSGDEFTFTLDFKNTSNSDNSVVSRLSYRYEGSEWYYTDEKLRLNVAAGKTRSWESGTGSLDRAGTYEYRLDDIDKTWKITSTE